MIATELSHVALGHPTRTEYAFNDRTMVSDEAVLENFHLCSAEEISTASQYTLQLLSNRPTRTKWPALAFSSRR